jgi:formate dehydrogenase major subunit
MSLANLQMLLGNMGVEGGGVNPMRGQNNVQGACDMGALPNMYCGYQRVAVPEISEKFARFWGVDGLSTREGLKIAEMTNGLPAGKVKAFWIFGENLVATEPDIGHISHCLNSAEFLVVQDIFRNETTPYADVILPSAAWCEDDGTFTNTERRVSRVRKIKEAPGEARPNWWIFKEVARRWGYDWPSNSGRDLWDREIAPLCPAFAGITFDRMDAIGGIQWPCPSEDHPGTAVLHRDGRFSRGKGNFQAIDWVPSAEEPDETYPFVLSTGRRLVHYHSRTQTGRAKGLNERMPEERADISIPDAERLGIANGETIRVVSRRGSVKIKANVSKRMPQGMVWMSFHFWETNANRLLSGDTASFDPDTLTPSYKACAVKIEKMA